MANAQSKILKKYPNNVLKVKKIISVTNLGAYSTLKISANQRFETYACLPMKPMDNTAKEAAGLHRNFLPWSFAALAALTLLPCDIESKNLQISFLYL